MGSCFNPWNMDLKEYYLYPGLVFVSAEPYVVSTVLGSCVSVCLWDPILEIGGINHFQLPLWNGVGLQLPKYGNIAMDRMIEKMNGLGSETKRLKAKVFGGAAVLNVVSGRMHVGERNVAVAVDVLKNCGIPIVSSHLGGDSGRKIKFNTSTGVVWMKLLKKSVFIETYSKSGAVPVSEEIE
jgi:chemotaxis protein CheD